MDQLHLFLGPNIAGRGKRALLDDIRVPLALLDERRFGNGVVHLHYRVAANRDDNPAVSGHTLLSR